MVKENSKSFQYFAGISANLISLSYGAYCGWPSASFLELMSEDSPLASGPMNHNEAGWVGAMLCVGGLLGTICFSYCADKIGRKKTLMLLALPGLIGWLIIPFATCPLHLMISRFFGGFSGGGAFTVIPIYTTELAEDKVRGMLGTFMILFCNVGVLLAFLLGVYCNYVQVAWILSTLPVAFLICFASFPETPQYLMKRHQEKKAEEAFRSFRNVPKSVLKMPDNVLAELEKLKNDDDSENKSDDSITWKDLNNKTARKALFIGASLMALNQLCGCFAMINYTASIFELSAPGFPPQVAALIVGAVQLFGSNVATTMIENAGRKFLLAISSVGTGLGLACLGGYVFLTKMGYDTSGFTFFPIASFAFTIFIACWGVIPLPFVIVAEIMPPKIRNLGTMMSMTLLWVFAFFILKFLPVLTTILGIDGLMFIFSVCCFIGAVFIVLVVPETKGKSIEAILAML